MKPAKSKSQQPVSEIPAGTVRETGSHAGKDATAQKTLSPGRLWSFRLIALLVIPLLLLGGLELGLRLAGYGYPTGFFKRARIGTADYLIENDKFGLRFFPPGLARSPTPVLMTAKKAPGTCRIFVFGESAAQGDPRPAYGASRYLQTLLRERFPQTSFEVICVATTAINSHTIVPIARECGRHQGDIWIIYMGNNEMVGPFGAITVFGSRALPWPYVRMSLAIQRTRIGQLLMALGRKLTERPRLGSSWGGMKMFLQNQLPATDSRKDVVYRNFRRNLEDILQAGCHSGAKIILNTVAVNLKDSPPFASMFEPSLPAADREACDKKFKEAMLAEAGGKLAEAAQGYEQAAARSPHFAELQFRWGECLLRSGNAAAAREHFQNACDYDALPFRSDSKINALIAQTGRKASNGPVVVFDAAAFFATNSLAGVPGAERFYEHVHFNFDGNYALALAWAERVENLLPAAATNHATDHWAEQDVCERWLGLSDWNRAGVLEDILQRLSQPPFSAQSNHAEREEAVRAQIRELRGRMENAAARVQASGLYVEALQRAPGDHRLHENFAEFLEDTGNLPQALTQWQRVRELIPQHHVAYFQSGRLLLRQGKLSEAEPQLSQALALRPDLAEGWLELGKLHALEGRTELALKDYDRERQLVPEDYRVYYHLGQALSKLNRRAEAIQNFREALRLRRGYWQARYSLAEELAFNGQNQEALSQFEEVLRLKPDHAMAHLNLGVAFFKLGRMNEAKQQFAEVLRLNPENRMAVDYLRQLQKAGDQKH